MVGSRFGAGVAGAVAAGGTVTLTVGAAGAVAVATTLEPVLIEARPEDPERTG